METASAIHAEQPQFSRRGVLKTIVNSAALLTVVAPLAEDFSKAQKKELLSPDTYIKPPLSSEPSNSPAQMVKTIVTQAAILTPVSELIERGGKKIGIPTGNAGRSEEEMKRRIKERPYTTFFQSCVLAPFVEEGLCRLVPSMVSTKEKGIDWTKGIITNLAFSAMHSFKPEAEEWKIWRYKLTPMVHSGALFLGLDFWHKMRTRGFIHPVLAHATHNVICYGLTVRKILR